MQTTFFARAVFAVIGVGSILVFGVEPARDELTAATWQWTATTADDSTSPSLVPDPARYTISFGAGRRFVANADCNEVTGTWRRQPPGRPGPLFVLLVTPDPTTLAACGPDSLSQAFIDDLASAASYVVADGVLTISLADGGAMTFR